MKENETKLTKGRILGYCAGDIFGGGAFTLVGMLYMSFLTDSILIGPATVGVMMLIGKIWDAIIDPFIGNLSERVRNKIGRRRVFFLAGIFHIAAAFIMLWLPLQSTSSIFKAIYFTLSYMLFATSFSLTMVPYHAMLPELTTDLKTRNRIVGIRSMFSNVSTLIAGTVPAMVIGIGNQISSGFGYLFMGICFGIFYTLPWIFVFKATKGLDTTDSDDVGRVEKINPFKAFFQNAKTVLKNRSFRKMLGLYLLSYTAMDIFMAIFIYFVRWYLGYYKAIDYTILLGIFMVTQLLSIPLHIKIANTKGKRFGFILSSLTWAFGTALMFVLATPEANKFLCYLCAFIMAIGAGGVAYLPWAMLPETMDVEVLISGVKKDGVYSGFLTFIRQLSQALALFVVGIFLDLIDYSINQYVEIYGKVDDPNARLAIYNALIADGSKLGYYIKIFTSLAPFILLILSAIVAFGYPINKNNYLLLQRQIKEHNISEKSDIEELEKLSGKGNLKI